MGQGKDTKVVAPETSVDTQAANGGGKTAGNRRSFVRNVVVGSGVAAAATIAAPNISRAQTTTWRFQSTWPQTDIFHEYAQDYVNRVNAMGGGRLELQLLPAGAVVGAFQMQDAVSAGALDGGHGVSAYWYGKNKAFSLFGTCPPYGWDANQFLGWFHYGGGEALYRELVNDMLGLDLVGFLSGPMPTQPLGWFTREITSAEDMQGLKYRTVGLAADLFAEMGVAVTILPGGEIVPAIDRRLIDGAEFNNPSSDKILGFQDVAQYYMIQSFHQRMEMFEIIFNKSKFDELADEQKAILRYAAEAASADMSWKQQDRYSSDLIALEEAGVNVRETPESVLQAQLAAWDTVIENLSADPFFKKVVDSQKAWTERIVGFYRRWDADNDMAYDHFFKS
ncbi:TRAP transporter substrate-binding protein [Marinivivus vitaminiproducens]|uniref:TRAP transporter substrate-binding protein n=1 Tax=Marinivivus vitaminiproducens TaxID=3035935 RepID=UPI00279BBD4C|nr:TRAP transporter substrate-binding protein [Geminicoccaceae bacterium SCSIO 64248]